MSVIQRKQKKSEESVDVIKDALVKNERIVDQAYIHWGIFLGPGVIAFIALLVGTFFHPLVGFVILIMAAVPGVRALILYCTARIAVTNKRIFIRFGYFSRDLIQIRLDKLETVHMEQPLAGQFLGYSTVILAGVGTGLYPVSFVKDGRLLVRRLQDYLLTDNEDEEKDKS